VLPLQIIFSEAWWIGSKVDNPDEKQLPMPADLDTPQVWVARFARVAGTALPCSLAAYTSTRAL
jgi:hypothetical protein